MKLTGAATGTAGGPWRHPLVTAALMALQVAPLSTVTVLSPALVTYTVPVAWSTAIELGKLPTVTVGHGPRHSAMSCAWQWRVSMTETVLPPAAGPLLLLPLAT